MLDDKQWQVATVVSNPQFLILYMPNLFSLLSFLEVFRYYDRLSVLTDAVNEDNQPQFLGMPKMHNSARNSNATNYPVSGYIMGTS